MSGTPGINKGNKHHWKGGRLRVPLSLSGAGKRYFQQDARQRLGRDLTDLELAAYARAATYAWWQRLARDAGMQGHGESAQESAGGEEGCLS